MSEFYGLEPGGLLPATALAQLDTARMEVIAAGRPDIPSTTPYTSTQLNAMAVGTEYRSTDGPQGAWRWRKTGSTSWTVTDGDTGWRNVTSLLANGWSSQAVGVVARRSSGIVTYYINALSAAAATNGLFLPFPAGFSLYGGAEQRSLLHTTAVTLRRTFTAGSGITVVSYQPADVLYGSTAGPTADSWPTTLPGSAV